jgi:hypothetical protein
MADQKETINKTLEEHHAIRDTVKLGGGPVSDFEALFALRQAYAGWSQCPPEELAAKHEQLSKTLELIDVGLKLHWDVEEKAMQGIFGGPLMKAFIFEHHDIARKIEHARDIIASEKLEELEPQALLSRKTAIQDIVNHVMQAIEEHSNHEDMIFKMIKKGLEGEEEIKK